MPRVLAFPPVCPSLFTSPESAMSVALEAVRFNHDPVSTNALTVNLRRNALAEVTVPEWVPGRMEADSLAAYAIARTRGRRPAIAARFRRTSSSVQRVWVRAVDATLSLPTVASAPPESAFTPGCAFSFMELVRLALRGLYGGLLGDVPALEIVFDTSEVTGWVEMPFEYHKLGGGVGVTKQVVVWRWQWRVGTSGEWTDFETTRHTVYALLDAPTGPWLPPSPDPTAPSGAPTVWTDALDFAVAWAAGARTFEAASAGVTRGINNLGPSRFVYDCPSGTANYTMTGTFNLTQFLARIRGEMGLGPRVNCDDCASAVRTFSNALGTDLRQGQMGDSIHLNPIVAIGWLAPSPGCPETVADNQGMPAWWRYHEAAWTGACLRDDRLFDACLRFGMVSPPELPVNIPFGRSETGQYRQRLATRGSSCGPTGPVWPRPIR